MKGAVTSKIIDMLLKDTSTYNIIKRTIGEDDVEEYFWWLFHNLRDIDYTGYDLEALELIADGDDAAAIGLIEDMYGMFLLDEKCFKNYYEKMA